MFPRVQQIQRVERLAITVAETPDMSNAKTCGSGPEVQSDTSPVVVRCLPGATGKVVQLYREGLLDPGEIEIAANPIGTPAKGKNSILKCRLSCSL